MANVVGTIVKKNVSLKRKRDFLVGLARKNNSVWREIVKARAGIITKAMKKNKKFAKDIQRALLDL